MIFVLIRRTVDVVAGEVLEITIPITAGTGTYAVITNDPMRAIHVLPGVATGDDLRSEFTVRGLPVQNMNFTFEGVSTPLLVHTVQSVHDSGSIAMVNGDVLEEITLAPGSYPQRHDNHTGAELNCLVRDGSRDGFRGLVRPSVTDTSIVLARRTCGWRARRVARRRAPARRGAARA